MSERPILFSAPMVRALLAGTKTQTRRVVKPQPEARHLVGVGPMLAFKKKASPDCWLWPNARDEVLAMCPYGQPGDRLWVREAWRCHAVHDHVPGSELGGAKPAAVQYLADAAKQAQHRWGRMRPGMFMPRWASRITLEVTAVRVERLQDIVPRDCEAEGVVRLPLQEDQPNPWYTADVSAGAKLHSRSTIGAYHKLWDSINGPGSWEANPWVWCVSFRRITP